MNEILLLGTVGIFCEDLVEFIEDFNKCPWTWNGSLHDKILIFVVGAVHCVPTALHAQGIPPGFLQAWSLRPSHLRQQRPQHPAHSRSLRPFPWLQQGSVAKKLFKKWDLQFSNRFIKNGTQPGKNMQQTVPRNSFLNSWNYLLKFVLNIMFSTHFLERTVRYWHLIRKKQLIFEFVSTCRI
jgi:hypothetical protein